MSAGRAGTARALRLALALCPLARPAWAEPGRVPAGGDQEYYTAAAFQSAIIGDEDDPACQSPAPGQPCHGRAAQRANLGKIGYAIGEAKRQGADIVVFNEGGIDADMWGSGNGGEAGRKGQAVACEPIPEPSDAILCGAAGWRDFPAAHNVSCLARQHGIVTVVNTCDRQPCRKGSKPCVGSSDVDCCPASGFELFNAQLAFSETGRLLAKYHKTHNYDTAPDFGETSDGLCCWPPRMQQRYFDTSFGVRFGMHICFDILWRTPGLAMALDPELGIRDFVYSTHWEAPGPPMLPSLAVQQGWSRAVGVNLIAANAGLGYNHAGSGLYSEGRAVAVHYDPTKAADDRLLIAKLPKLAKRVAANVVKADPLAVAPDAAPPLPAPAFRSFDVLPGGPRHVHNFSTALGSFSCSLTAVLSETSSVSSPDRYLFMAVNGTWMGKGNLPSRSCVLVRCGSLSESVCAARATCMSYTDTGCPDGRSLWNNADDIAAITAFDTLELRGSFRPGDVVLPMVSLSMGRIVERDDIFLQGGYMRAALGKPLLSAMLFAIPADEGPQPVAGALPAVEQMLVI